MTPTQFTTPDGQPFPSTVLDDRAGRERHPGSGVYEMIDSGQPAQTLEPDVFAAVRTHTDAGQRKLDAGDFTAAFQAFYDALNLLPEPQQQWNACGWLLVAMGECGFRTGSWESAIGPLQDSTLCPGTLGNPWVHLRLGQIRFELGEIDRAADELARAYMGGGREIFADQDPKYFALVENVLRPPPGMDRLP